MQNDSTATISADQVLHNLHDIIIKPVEKLMLQHRAEKYQLKEDCGGIAYIRKTVKAGDIVFDIGAHKAGYLYFFLEQCGSNGTIVAFEPQSVLYSYLCRLKKMFAWHQVTIESYAVSAKSGNALLCVPYNSGRNSSPCATIIESLIDFEFQFTEKVNTISLDQYCLTNNIYPDFLKVDVEGNELSVFKGAKKLLQTHRPKILFESEARFVGKVAVKETFQFLSDFGYKGSFIHGTQRLPIDEFNIDYHQNHMSGCYCNNFIFE